MSVKMKMIDNNQEKINKNNKLTFWLFNIANAICTIYTIVAVYINMCDKIPAVAFNIAVVVLYQSMFALILNILLHKATKNKEVFLDD